MKTLVITNDYFPKKGGISTYIKSFENHLEFEKIIYAPNWAEGPNVVNSKSRFIFGSRTHLREIKNIIPFLKEAQKLKYKVIVNLMQSNDRSEKEIQDAMKNLNKAL